MMSRCGPHQPMTCARVLYMGKAAPQASHDGLDSVQKPLAELYSKSEKASRVDDHDATLYVYSSGLLMRPVNPLDKDIWLRIQDLESCASVKAYNDPTYYGRLMFVPTDSEAGRSTPHPSVFAVVMKRTTGGIKISDCHAFICCTDKAGMTLVRACEQAFADPRGWSSERPSLIDLGLERPEVKIDNECYVDDIKEDCGQEFYDKPSLSGFFYTPRSDLVQKYNIRGEDNFGQPICQPKAIEHFTCDQPEPPKPSPCQTGCPQLPEGYMQITCAPEMACPYAMGGGTMMGGVQPMMMEQSAMMAGYQPMMKGPAQFVAPQMMQMFSPEPVYAYGPQYDMSAYSRRLP